MTFHRPDISPIRTHVRHFIYRSHFLRQFTYHLAGERGYHFAYPCFKCDI